MNIISTDTEAQSKNFNGVYHNKYLLKDIIGKALQSRKSGFQVRDIFFLESTDDIGVLPETVEERLNIDLATANSVLKDLIWIGERVCTNAAYNENTDEDTINDYFRDMLCGKGYTETKDQTRHGISGNENKAGEVDLLLTRDGKEIALFEGIIPYSSTDTRIGEHIDKAISNYNALGTSTFIVAYIRNVHFDDFWRKYYSYISTYDYCIPIKKDIVELTSPNASTKIAQIILSKDGFDFPVFFLCLKMRKK